jgi:hypothetical protein
MLAQLTDDRYVQKWVIVGLDHAVTRRCTVGVLGRTATLKNPQPTWRFLRQFRASSFPDQAVSSGPPAVSHRAPVAASAWEQSPANRRNPATRLGKRKGRDSNPGDRSRGLTVFKTARVETLTLRHFALERGLPPDASA